MMPTAVRLRYERKVRNMFGLVRGCPQSDSNRHWADFKIVWRRNSNVTADVDAGGDMPSDVRQWHGKQGWEVLRRIARKWPFSGPVAVPLRYALALTGLVALLALSVALLAPTPSHDVNVSQGPLQARPTPPPKAVFHITKDGRFIALLAAHGAGQRDAATGKDLGVQNAHIICENLENGGSWQDQATMALQNIAGYDEQKADFFVETAIQFYCPQAWH